MRLIDVVFVESFTCYGNFQHDICSVHLLIETEHLLKMSLLKHVVRIFYSTITITEIRKYSYILTRENSPVMVGILIYQSW